MAFEFATASRVVFGRGKALELGALVRPWGSRALWVSGSSDRFGDLLRPQLETLGIHCSTVTISAEPTVQWAQENVARFRDGGIEFVVAVGGGSVLDAGKALAALIPNPGGPLDYLEVIGQGRPLIHRSLPVAALPTTAGTGSEVTRNAVLRSELHGVKASLRSASMLPALALVDSTLCDGLPVYESASTGMDALTQLLEPLVCNRTNPMTDALAKEGLSQVATAIRKVGTAATANVRDAMSLASLFGGICLANSGLGAVHGVAAVVGGRYEAAHGAVCAALLGPIVRCNVQALVRRGDPAGTLSRYGDAAHILSQGRVGAQELAGWLDDLSAELGIRRLAALGVSAADLPEVARQSLLSSSMKANPVNLELDELTQALHQAL